VAEKLVNQGCNVLVGAFDSGQTIASVQVAEQKGIPYIVHIGAAPQITESGYKWVVRNFPTVPMILDDAFVNQKALFEYTKKPPKTVVIIHANDTYGTIINKLTPGLAKKHNMPYKILDSIAYDPAAKDLSLEVAKAKASGAEAVIGVSRINDAILITREMIKQRWVPMGIMSPGPGWNDVPYMKTLGKMSDDIVSFIPWYDPTKPLSKKLAEAIKPMYPGRQLHVNHVLTFEGIYIACDAFKRAGTTEPHALMKALKETHITNNASISPAISFNEKGQNVDIKDAGVQNEGELIKVIIPRSASNAEPIWPMRPWNKRA
jgi:branched-chain amino acid transport system substrate-binding protein